MTPKGTAVATTTTPGNAPVPTELESLFQAEAGAGLEDMTQRDRVTPFIGLIQALSPQVDKNKAQYIAGAEAGDMFNTVTGEIYKTEDGGMQVVPVLFQKIYNAWIPRDLGGGFLGSYEDPELKRPIFVPPSFNDYEDAVQIQETANHYVLTQSQDGSWSPAVISMTSTKLKASRAWNTLVTMNAAKYKAPVYARIYRLTSVSQSNAKGTFYNFKAEDAGFVSADLFSLAKQFRKDIQAGLVKVDPTKSTEATEAEATAADPTDPNY